jgi:hypothetical protein
MVRVFVWVRHAVPAVVGAEGAAVVGKVHTIVGGAIVDLLIDIYMCVCVCSGDCVLVQREPQWSGKVHTDTHTPTHTW